MDYLGSDMASDSCFADLEDDMTGKNQCEHGQLARVCLTCEQTSEIDALREEVARLKAARIQFSDIHSCHDGCTRPGCVNGRLRAQVAALEGDAGRYKYLRDDCPWTMCVDGDNGRTATVSLHIKVSKDLMVKDGEDDFDAAIDAALAARKGGGHDRKVLPCR